MTATPLTRRLMPPKARLQALLEEVSKLEARAHRSKPIEVFRVARCGHPECGCAAPAEIPSDALVIEMGCQYLIPSVTPPEGLEQGYQSRVERRRADAVGQGLGSEGVRRTISLIQLLNK